METSTDTQARRVQTTHFVEYPDIHPNAMMQPQRVKTLCQISDEGRTLLKTAMKRLGPSAHAHYRVLEVARTIADQVGPEAI